MNFKKLLAGLFTAAALLFSAGTIAQSPPPYGMAVTNEQAKKAMAMAAAEAEAKKNNWNVVIAIADSGGNMVMLQRLDNAQFDSVNVATEKAHGAAAFRRPTVAFQDLIAQGGVHLRLLNIAGDASMFEGGVPIIVDGKIIGAIGVSGATSQQGAQIAKAGAGALK